MNSVAINTLTGLTMLGLTLLMVSQPVRAVTPMSAAELAGHCRQFPTEPNSLDGEFCARYVQGFIDGAIATDARVMVNVEAELRKQSEFSKRAMQTRVLSRSEYVRATQYAEYCLGDPVPLSEVVMHVVDELNDAAQAVLNQSAREAVYSTLKRHYPC